MPFVKFKKNKIIKHEVHFDGNIKIRTPDNFKKMKFSNNLFTVSLKYMNNSDYNFLESNISLKSQ